MCKKLSKWFFRKRKKFPQSFSRNKWTTPTRGRCEKLQRRLQLIQPGKLSDYIHNEGSSIGASHVLLCHNKQQQQQQKQQLQHQRKGCLEHQNNSFPEF